MIRRLVIAAILATALPALAEGDGKCLAVAMVVPAAVQADVMKADNLYARGEFQAALDIYAKAHAQAKAPALLYAQAMARLRLGASAEAKAMFEAYLNSAGSLKYRDQVEGNVADLRAGVAGGVGAWTGTVGTGVGGAVDAGGEVTGTVRSGVDAGLGVTARAKPPKVAKGAAVVLGVVAVAAVGVVAAQSIRGGISDEIDLDFDPKFHPGLGLTGAAVGVTAIYLYGLTASTGSVRCASLPDKTPIVAPVALPGGGGLTAAMRF